MLADKNGEVFLCLHKWREHDHPSLSKPQIQPSNGLILYLKVEDLGKVWANAKPLKAKIEEPKNVNPNSGKEEFSLRKLYGSYHIISK